MTRRMLLAAVAAFAISGAAALPAAAGSYDNKNSSGWQQTKKRCTWRIERYWDEYTQSWRTKRVRSCS
jgi:hypothetical protein